MSNTATGLQFKAVINYFSTRWPHFFILALDFFRKNISLLFLQTSYHNIRQKDGLGKFLEAVEA